MPGAAERLAENLQWAGIPFDEGPGKEGSVGPYVQSQRLPLYREHAQRLLQRGHAYHCFCTEQRLEARSLHGNGNNIRINFSRLVLCFTPCARP